MDAFAEIRIRVRRLLLQDLDECEPGLPDHERRIRVREAMDAMSEDEALAIAAEAAVTA